ncbi:unnamed protein product [Symbiodinium microadriaticum]|nr:unnamed protein product [Symbiodinium microadriaticum]
MDRGKDREHDSRPLLSFTRHLDADYEPEPDKCYSSGQEFLRRGPPHVMEGPHSYAVLWAAWVSGTEGLRLLDEVISWQSIGLHQ